MQVPFLGLGVVYVPGLEPLLEPGNSCIDVLEIEPQPLWHFRNGVTSPYVMPAATLSHLHSLPQRKIVHSVGFAPAGSYQYSDGFFDALACTVKSLDAPLVSEHLSFTNVQSNGRTLHTGFMLPPLQTQEGVHVAAGNIRTFAKRLPAPLAIETTVNYLKPRQGEMTDGEFVAAVAEESGCGILLDLHNIWTNEKNGRQAVDAFLKDIPMDRVWEVHLGGGFEMDSYWLDAHSGAVPPDVMDIAREVTPHLQNMRAVVFEVFPSFLPVFGLSGIQRQLELIREQLEVPSRAEGPADCINLESRPAAHLDTAESKPDRVSEWEVGLAELVTQGHSQKEMVRHVADDDALPMIRKLVWRFRAGAILKSLNALSELIRITEGDDFLESVLDGYFGECPPQPFASEEALQFLAYVDNQDFEIPFISDIIKYERCVIRALVENVNKYDLLEHDPTKILASLRAGEIPQGLSRGSFELEVTP